MRCGGVERGVVGWKEVWLCDCCLSGFCVVVYYIQDSKGNKNIYHQ